MVLFSSRAPIDKTSEGLHLRIYDGGGKRAFSAKSVDMTNIKTITATFCYPRGNLAESYAFGCGIEVYTTVGFTTGMSAWTALAKLRVAKSSGPNELWRDNRWRTMSLDVTGLSGHHFIEVESQGSGLRDGDVFCTQIVLTG